MSSVSVNPNSAAPITLPESNPVKPTQSVGHQHVALNAPPQSGKSSPAPVSNAAVVDISTDARAAAKA